MYRVIKFRGKSSDGITFVYGYLLQDKNEEYSIFENDISRKTKVDYDTIGQFTGIFDKHGKEIYEGDTIQYYSLKYDSLSYEYIITKHVGNIEFINGSFVCKETKTHYEALCNIGLFNLKEVWNDLSHWDDEEKGPYYDYIGNCADENIIGITVIGNIFTKQNTLKK